MLKFGKRNQIHECSWILIDKRSHSHNYDMGRWMVESLEKTSGYTWVHVCGYLEPTILRLRVYLCRDNFQDSYNCSYCFQRQFCNTTLFNIMSGPIRSSWSHVLLLLLQDFVRIFNLI